MAALFRNFFLSLAILSSTCSADEFLCQKGDEFFVSRTSCAKLGATQRHRAPETPEPKTAEEQAQRCKVLQLERQHTISLIGPNKTEKEQANLWRTIEKMDSDISRSGCAK